MSWRYGQLCLMALLPLAVGCGANIKENLVARAVTHPTGPAGAAPSIATLPAGVPNPPPVDPVAALIADSNNHFTAGQKALDEGHLDAARHEFNRAVDVLLESPYGARTDPRIRAHFDSLVDRISAYEVKALAEGDGFTEKKYEAASIDELLALTSTFGHPPAPPALKTTVQSDLASNGHDIAIPLNSRVLSYIELFQGRLHDFMEDGLRRGSQYLPMIQRVFRAEGLPLDLAYVPLVESAFKPNALSRTKAKGVWQFMSRTAAENGLRHDWYVDERSDPEKATVAAAHYLKSLAELFDGDWHLALASYNGGPGRVQHAMKVSGIDDFWKLAARPRLLPRETREYVPMILAAIIIARNPAQYGFTFDPEQPRAYEKVTLDRPVDLRRIAEWSETTIDELQSLNPELRRWTTPIRDNAYELKVPAGTADMIQAHLADASATELASLRWYTVKRGDSLLRIARKLHVSRNDLADANYLSARARVTPGEKLMVPQETTVLMAANTERNAGGAGDNATSGRVKAIYHVKRGDTLIAIAQTFHTTVTALRTWNPTVRSDRLLPGQRLTVYRPAPQQAMVTQ